MEGVLSVPRVPSRRMVLAFLMALSLWWTAAASSFAWSEPREIGGPVMPACTNICTQNITWE